MYHSFPLHFPSFLNQRFQSLLATCCLLVAHPVGDGKRVGAGVQQTREAMGKPKRVLLIQDTTEVDYQAHPTSTGLGPIGNGTHHGFLLQSVLAVLPQSREMLGLAPQEPRSE